MSSPKPSHIQDCDSLEESATPSHPLAGRAMSGAEMVVQVLADEGVDTVFGYSGGAILPTYDAVFRHNINNDDDPIELIVPASEQGAGFMAAGYARSSGRVGVSLVTSGPGATNSVTPVRDCQADSVPMVLLCGQVPREAIGTDAFQEAPIFNIMASCAKHVFLLTDETKIEETIRSAFDIARSGRPGPVVIDLPKDIQNFQGVFKGRGKLKLRGYDERRSELESSKLRKDQGKSFFDLLARAERPLIYCGGGVIAGNAAEEMSEFAQAFGIPVVTTLMGIGAIDTTSKLSLRMLGMHGTAFANYSVEDCDFLFSVGARFDDRVAGKVSEFAPNAKIAHLDIDASEIDKVKSVDWSFVCDARQGLRQLLAAGRGFKKDFETWRTHCSKLRSEYEQNFDREGRFVRAEYVLEAMNKITEGKAIVSTGVGQHQMWAAQYIDFKHPRHWITSGSMGTMGFGLPAAIGAKFANPDKLVIDVDGDGSIRMNLGELETLTNYGVDVKVLLLNNMGDGMVRQWQDLFYENRYSGTDKALHKKDFIAAAEADGFKFARRIDKVGEVEEALKAFIEFDGPAFLEVMTDRTAHVYPMVGPGVGYSEMITGDHIKSRAKSQDKTTPGESDGGSGTNYF